MLEGGLGVRGNVDDDRQVQPLSNPPESSANASGKTSQPARVLNLVATPRSRGSVKES